MRRRKFGNGGDNHKNYFFAAAAVNGDRNNNTLYDKGQRKSLLEDLEYHIYLAKQTASTLQDNHSQLILEKVLNHRNEFSSNHDALSLIYDSICSSPICKNRAFFQSLLLSYTALLVSASLQGAVTEHSLSFFSSEKVICVINASKRWADSCTMARKNHNSSSLLKDEGSFGFSRKRKYFSKSQQSTSFRHTPINNTFRRTVNSDTQEELSIEFLVLVFLSRTLFAINVLHLTQNNITKSDSDVTFDNDDLEQSQARSESYNFLEFLHNEVNQIQAGILDSNISIQWIDSLCISLSNLCGSETKLSHNDANFESWLFSEALSECILHVSPNTESKSTMYDTKRARKNHNDVAADIFRLFDNYQVSCPLCLFQNDLSFTIRSNDRQSQQYFFDAIYLYLRYLISIDSHDRDKLNILERRSKYIWPMNIAIFPDLSYGENVDNDKKAINDTSYSNTTVFCSLDNVKLSLLKLLITATHPQITISKDRTRLLTDCTTLSWLLHIICDKQSSIADSYGNNNELNSTVKIEQEMLVSLLSLAVNISSSISDRLALKQLCLRTIVSGDSKASNNSKNITREVSLVEKLASCLCTSAACFQSDLEATDSFHVRGESHNNNRKHNPGGSEDSVPIAALVTAAHFSLLIHSLIFPKTSNEPLTQHGGYHSERVNEVCVAVCRVLPRHNLWLLTRVLTAYVSLCCVTNGTSDDDSTVSQPFQNINSLSREEQDNLRSCLAALHDLQQLNIVIASEDWSNASRPVSNNKNQSPSVPTIENRVSPFENISCSHSVVNTDSIHSSNLTGNLKNTDDDWIFSTINGDYDNNTFVRQKTRTFASSERVPSFSLQLNECSSFETNSLEAFKTKSDGKVEYFDGNSGTDSTKAVCPINEKSNQLEQSHYYGDIDRHSFGDNVTIAKNCKRIVTSNSNNHNETNNTSSSRPLLVIGDCSNVTDINNRNNHNNNHNKSKKSNSSTDSSLNSNHTISMSLTQLLSRSIHSSYSSHYTETSSKGFESSIEGSQSNKHVFATVGKGIVEQSISRLPTLKRAKMTFSQIHETISSETSANNNSNDNCVLDNRDTEDPLQCDKYCDDGIKNNHAINNRAKPIHSNRGKSYLEALLTEPSQRKNCKINNIILEKTHLRENTAATNKLLGSDGFSNKKISVTNREESQRSILLWKKPNMSENNDNKKITKNKTQVTSLAVDDNNHLVQSFNEVSTSTFVNNIGGWRNKRKFASISK